MYTIYRIVVYKKSRKKEEEEKKKKKKKRRKKREEKKRRKEKRRKDQIVDRILYFITKVHLYVYLIQISNPLVSSFFFSLRIFIFTTI